MKTKQEAEAWLKRIEATYRNEGELLSAGDVVGIIKNKASRGMVQGVEVEVIEALKASLPFWKLKARDEYNDIAKRYINAD